MVKSDAGACACTYFAGVLYAENKNWYDYHLRRNSINVLSSNILNPKNFDISYPWRSTSCCFDILLWHYCTFISVRSSWLVWRYRASIANGIIIFIIRINFINLAYMPLCCSCSLIFSVNIFSKCNFLISFMLLELQWCSQIYFTCSRTSYISSYLCQDSIPHLGHLFVSLHLKYWPSDCSALHSSLLDDCWNYLHGLMD